MCVCTGNASLISRKIKGSVLHLPCLPTKRSSKLPGACVWSLCISGLQFGEMREGKLILIEHLLCARHGAGFAQIIPFLKQLCEAGVLIPILKIRHWLS